MKRPVGWSKSAEFKVGPNLKTGNPPGVSLVNLINYHNNPSTSTQLMHKHIRDSEQGIGDFCMQNPNNEKFVLPRGLDDHGRSQAHSRP